jgi:hypothetical protein
METGAKVSALGMALPGMGYALSLAICAVCEKWFMGRWGATGRELTWFVLAPALFSLTHIVQKRRVQSSWGYDILAGMWGGAAVIGLVSHWRGLGAVGPLLSLLRYALIALAGGLFCISTIVQRPLFATRDASGPVLGRVLVALVGVAMLAVCLGVVALVIYLTPFPVALVPPEQGLAYQRVWKSDSQNYLVWMAWSPDSRTIVGQGHGIWLVEPAKRTALQVAGDAIISPDRPWNANGDGFFCVQSAPGGGGVWFASVKSKTLHGLVAGQVGVPSCSPDGTGIAFDSGKGLVVARADGTEPKVVAESGEVPLWAPDGKHLLVTRTTRASRSPSPITRAGSSYWVVSLDGESWLLDVPVVALDEVAWVSGDAFATIVVKEGPKIPLLGVRRTAAVTTWDLKGRRVNQHSLGSYLGGAGCSLAASRDGRRLAVATDMEAPFGDSLVLLDLKSGRFRRLPASPYGAVGLAWSPDGRSLALSDVKEVTEEEKYAYLSVISGFKLFDKEKP